MGFLLGGAFQRDADVMTAQVSMGFEVRLPSPVDFLISGFGLRVTYAPSQKHKYLD